MIKRVEEPTVKEVDDDFEEVADKVKKPKPQPKPVKKPNTLKPKAQETQSKPIKIERNEK